MTDQHDTTTTSAAPEVAAPPSPDPFAGRRAAAEHGAAPRPSDKGDGVSGERGISPVAGRMSTPQAKIAGIAGMVGIAALLIGVTWDRGDAKPTKPKDPARQTVRYDQVASTDAPPLPPAPTLGAGGIDPVTGQPLAPGQVVPAPVTGAGSTASGGAPSRESLSDLTRRAPLVAYSHSGSQQAGGVGAGGAEAVLPSAQGALARHATDLENLRRGSAITTVRATALGDRNYLILAGTQIPCVLQTAMDSSLPGYTTCIVPRDVLSDNGRVVLLEKGTKVLGEYRGGMQRGQRRLFILWTRAVTPRGIAIDLASPGADALGRSGFGGDVDNRFFERFGAALLLSLVDDGVYAATAGNGRSYQNTARVPSDIANTALEGSINIAPILRKNQGEDVGIMVARDFDFSDVYGVEAR